MVKNFLGCRKRNAADDLVVKGSRRINSSSSNSKGPDYIIIHVNVINAAALLQSVVENFPELI